jgi:hypothetical protein
MSEREHAADQCCGFGDRGVAHVDPVAGAGAADRAIVRPQPATSASSRSAAQAAHSDRFARARRCARWLICATSAAISAARAETEPVLRIRRSGCCARRPRGWRRRRRPRHRSPPTGLRKKGIGEGIGEGIGDVGQQPQRGAGGGCGCGSVCLRVASRARKRERGRCCGGSRPQGDIREGR